MHNVLGIHVSIANGLVNNKNLTVHCKSGDDNLGVHVLPFSKNFGWDFKRNIFGTTQFYCSFEWTGEFHWFDIYISRRDRCQVCNWVVSEKGPITQVGSGLVQYPWNK
uniref:S-protein homolog n=1 Tax=Cicer arietinum TaxID=3827 RepID=A0A1S2YUV2_CICAR|nr:S-protein homolog 5-like [Cicer arietinum]